MWAYAKRVFGKHNKFHFTPKGASEDLYFDIAVLSGATAPQGIQRENNFSLFMISEQNAS